jgi:hypothetical protein
MAVFYHCAVPRSASEGLLSMSAPTLAAAQPADTSLKDDLLTGVAAIAAFTGDSERRIRNGVQKADAAAAAGELDDGSWLPFFRRHGLICSRKSWLLRWYSGEAVIVPRGGPKSGKGPRRKAQPAPEPGARISPRTGRVVRRYTRRTPEVRAAEDRP